MNAHAPTAGRAAAVLAAFLTSVAPLGAHDWYVDVNDPQCPTGDGSPGKPFCSIQDAIDAASFGDTVHVAPGTYFERLHVDKDLHLWGTGGDAVTRVDGSAGGTVVEIDDGLAVEIVGLTITNGGGPASYGGILAGIGGDLTLLDSTITGNRAPFAGLWGAGTLTLRNSTISDNNGYVHGYVWFGGVYWGGTATVDDCEFVHNIGSGVYLAGGTLTLSNTLFTKNGYSAVDVRYGTATIDRCTIDDNSTGYGLSGGGIRNAGTMTVSNTTISHNDANVYGYGGGVANFGTMTMINCTLSTNDAYDYGGGILNSKGTLTLESCTVADNTCNYSPGGIQNRPGATLTIANTIIADNSPTDCTGTLTSAGYNLIGNSAGCTIVGDSTGNLIDVDPILQPLTEQGGPTSTHGLHPGSPARDAANPDPAKHPPADQRGVPRRNPDMGAFEYRLSLDIDANVAGSGDSVKATTAAGLPGSPALLYVVEIDGTPFVQRLFTGVLDFGGSWSVTSNVPPGLEGTDLRLATLAFDSSGTIAITNLEEFSIR